MPVPNFPSLPEKIINSINSIQEYTLPDIRAKLILLINELINSDFQALVQLLYQIDVNEKKLKVLLNKDLQIDSASLIADLIIERQMQKIKSRNEYLKKKSDEESSEEKW